MATINGHAKTNAVTTTYQLTSFLTELTWDSIPEPVQQNAKSLLLDTLCCLRSGAGMHIAQQIKSVSAIFGGTTQASCAGSTELIGMTQALYVNTRLSNLLDMDETFPIGTHFGIGAVCAAIAACEAKYGKTQQSLQGAELLTSIVAGYEAAARVATAIGPIIKVKDGQVEGYAKVWGVAAPVAIAACAAYARMMGPKLVTRETLEQAFGIAVSNIPLPIGSRWAAAANVADCKYCDAGWCAVTGVHGVVSAMAGLSGFENIFDGDGGLPEAYAAEMPRPESLTEQLGGLWYMADITFKPWPTCRWMHGAQTALAMLLKTHPVSPEDIEEVTIFTGPVSNDALFTNPAPCTFSGYSFSYPHAVAMMLLRVTPGPKWYDLSIAESASAIAIRKKVRVELLEGSESFARDMVRNQIRTMPGTVTVKTVQGNLLNQRSEYSGGDPWHNDTRYDFQEVVNKYQLATNVSDGESLLEWFKTIETTSTVEPLTSFIRQSG